MRPLHSKDNFEHVESIEFVQLFEEDEEADDDEGVKDEEAGVTDVDRADEEQELCCCC